MGFKPSFNPDTGRIKVQVRLSYFNGFKKTKSSEKSRELFRTNGLIDQKSDEGKASEKVIKKALKHCFEQAWAGKDFDKMWGGFDWDKKGLLDGNKYTTDDGDIRDHYEDQWFLKLTTDKKPKFYRRNGEVLDLSDDDDRAEAEDLFQSGHHAIAYFHVYAQKDKEKGGPAIFASWDGLQFFKRDEKFGGGGMDDDEVEKLEDDEDEDDDL